MRHGKKRAILVLISLAFLISSTVGFILYSKYKSSIVHEENKKDNLLSENLTSRIWMEYAMDIVRKEKPSPVEASRLYAYVATVYYDEITIGKTNNSFSAGEAVRQIINQIYPDQKDLTDLFFKNHYGKDSITLNETQKKILNTYQEREKSDGMHTLQWDGKIPTGVGKWIKTNKEPYSPRAGEWKRWIVEGKDFEVPAPPAVNSPQDKQELQIVTEAIAQRDSEWNKKIIFWQGIPGTETPSGIWQNLLFDKIKESGYSDVEYAKYQKILAQSLADSFMECWKVKYTYWTARPSMRIQGIVTSMPDPPFPSYLSGHSTISRTSAVVLSQLFPEHKDFWMNSAEEAKQSRLYAGIHFDIDNREGAKLGEKIGEEIITTMNL